MPDWPAIDALKGHPLLAYLDYPAGSSMGFFFPYPQFDLGGEGILPIDGQATFPKHGSIYVRVSGASARNIKDDYGNIAIVSFTDIQHNDGDAHNSEFHTVCNAYRADSPFRIERIETRARDILPIVDIVDDPALEDPGRESGHLFDLAPDAPTQLPATMSRCLVRVRGTGGTAHALGPFRATPIYDRDQVRLEALAERDYRVFDFNVVDLGIHSLGNNHRQSVFQFVGSRDFDALVHEGRQARTIDWIGNDQLERFVLSSFKASDSYAQLTRGDGAQEPFDEFFLNWLDQTIEVSPDGARSARMAQIAARLHAFKDGSPALAKDIAKSLPVEGIRQLLDDPEALDIITDRASRTRQWGEALRKSRQALKERYDAQVAELKRVEREVEEATAELDRRRAELARTPEPPASPSASTDAAGAADERDGLARRAEELRGEVQRLEEEKRDLERDIDGIVDLLGDRRELTREVLKSEAIRRVSAVAGSSFGEERLERRPPRYDLLSPAEDDDAVRSLLEGALQWIRSQGRSLQMTELINYLVCLAQGYVTTFAGPPGSGKTSICRLLGQSLGLTAENRRLVEINVERGWTSYRDFIGYYNPLSQSVVRTNPKAYDAFEDLSEQAASEPGAVPPCFFILDEANLSPIEHYWANFFEACDSFELALPIRKGDPLVIPRFARFLATVNYDHTSEEFSPRFLDRSWVIWLASQGGYTEGGLYDERLERGRIGRTAPAEASLPERSMSYRMFEDIFAPADPPPMEEEIVAIYEAIRRICQTSMRPISHRSNAMICSYVRSAARLFELFGIGSPQLTALDYAITQKVLPTVQGTAGDVEPFLDGLKTVCESLRIASGRIDDMLAKGKDYGYIQYFA